MYSWHDWKILAGIVIDEHLENFTDLLYDMQMRKQSLWVRRYYRMGRREVLRRMPYQLNQPNLERDSDLIREWDSLVFKMLGDITKYKRKFKPSTTRFMAPTIDIEAHHTQKHPHYPCRRLVHPYSQSRGPPGYRLRHAKACLKRS